MEMEGEGIYRSILIEDNKLIGIEFKDLKILK